MASTRAIGRAPHTCCRAPGAIDRSESRTPLLTFGPASDETVSITPTVRGILRRSVPKHWSSYGLAVIAGLAAAVGCGTDGGTGPAADYTLSLTPAALTIVRGLSGSTTVAISRTNFTGAVTLSLASAPVGVIRSFNPAAPTGTNATLTVSVGAAVAPGVYNLTVNGAATPGTRSTTLTLTVNASSGGSGITTVVAATEYSCALNASGQAYCWGGNGNGQLGATSSETCVDARLESSNPCSTRPLAVSGGLTLAMLSASYSYTSALSTSGALYWWGDGTTTPTPVAGGLTFAEVSASYSQTCGVTTSGAAYCGGNATTAPTPVPGGLTFATVSVGGYGHVCGVTTSEAAYCWGDNVSGQLGDGTTTDRPVPTPVAGGLKFATLSAGWAWTCGITTDGAAYCWGGSFYGALGNGTTANQLIPTPVAGGLKFASLSAGDGHTCGVTMSGAAYCWGDNQYGQLGDGTTTQRPVPTPVVGGHSFAVVSAGTIVPFFGHTCGVTTSGVVYCWGDNFAGELGDGTTTQRLVPTAVAFP